MLSVKCANDENPDAMTGKRRNQRLHNSGGLKIERADRSQANPSMFGLYPFGAPGPHGIRSSVHHRRG